MSFGGDAFTLFPTSSVLISTRRFPKSGVAAQQIIQLRRNPAVYADTFTPSPTGGVVSLTKIQDGGSAKNESFLLKIGRDAIGGGVVLNYGANSTTAIPIGASAASFTSALQAVTGIGAGNISVDSAANSNEYTISFVKALGNTNISTGFTLDPSGVVFANFIQSTVTMATAELDELFAEAGTDSITPTLEIEVSQSGKTSTVYQSSIGVRRDLITTGSVVPAAQASYYTKSEADAKFVEDAGTGVPGSIDASQQQLLDQAANPALNYENRECYDSAGLTSIYWESRELAGTNGFTAVDWQNRTLKNNEDRAIDWGNRQLISTNGASKMFEWAGGIAFFGVTTKSQVTQGSAVSALINYGLLASSTTYGALPLSSKTLTTTASITFGTVNNNSTATANVTVTGASINDVVMLGLPSAICQGLSFYGHVTTANVVEIDAVNATNGNITQSDQTFRVVVIGY